MRGVFGLALVAVWAWRSGLRQGRTEGELLGTSRASAVFVAGLREGRS
jgi:hypothetical protein